MYYEKYERDIAHQVQKHAAKHKLGPKVGRKFTVDDGDRYGYITQYAKPIDSLSDKQEEKIYKELKSIGIDSSDVCKWNCGMINGKIVCIDFDNGSCYKD